MKKITGILSSLVLLYSCEAKVDIKPTSLKQEQKTEESINIKVLPFPDDNSFSNDYLLENFWRLDYDKAGQDLSYLVIVPKDVKPTAIDPTPMKGTGLTNIGVYSRVESQEPYLEIWVYYEHLSSMVQPADWVKEKLKLVGHEIINQKEITSPQGNKYIDVLSQKPPYITRTTEYVNGRGDYIMLTITCEEKDYENMAETIQHISSNWKLK